MASGGSERDRLPQFTSSNYEIPSWQIAWNKPWYQQFEEKRNTQSKYNSRGHVLECKCSLCEEDMESAFSPQPSNVTHVFKTSSTEGNMEETFPSREKQEKPQNQKRERVILFSDLPEVTPSTSTSTSAPQTNTNTSAGSASNFFSSEGNSGVNTDALFLGLGAISSIQSIRDRVTDIQTRVNQFSGTKDSREFIVLRGLLVTTLAELNRIDAVGIRWLQQAKNIAMESIHDLLTQLKSKINEEDDIWPSGMPNVVFSTFWIPLFHQR